MRGMETREKMAGMEILVTGAGGFVGSALAPELVGRGHAVRAATRDPGRHRAPAGAVAHRFDLDDEASIAAFVNGKIDEIHVLPAMGFTYRPLEGLALRGAWSQTVARPSFREMGFYVSVEPAAEFPSAVTAAAECAAAQQFAPAEWIAST